MEKDYEKGQSDNLPKVDSFMVAQYLSANSDYVAAEMRGVKLNKCLISCVALCASKATSAGAGARNEVRSFPEWLQLGAATASYQVEGAWNEDGKSESIWDAASHREPCVIRECHTGDIADDSYHNVERDVEIMRELGLDFYRFSLSWTRIMPTSFPDQINEAGVQYYNRLIDEMLKYNIQPMITLYHWDLPQKVQDVGGWTNPFIIDWFTDYARVAFELFGDRVKYWITFNEPREVCYQGYGSATMAPLLNYTGWADYMCAKNLLQAHARVYHMYDEEFRPQNGGTIGITISAGWFEPESDSEEDIAAAHAETEFNRGLYAHPIFSESGDYPPVMKANIAAKSAEQGLPRSRLPILTPAQVEYIKGTSDFFGLNHYTTAISKPSSEDDLYPVPSMYNDIGATSYAPDDWKGSASTWLKVVPWGFYKLLKDIKEKYNNPPVFITENGFSSFGGLEDDDRISYFVQYLGAMLDAIEEGCDVRAYTAWSLMDNFEWLQGFVERFGLYEVDYEVPERTRTPRKSAFVYKEILRTRQLDPAYEPPADRVMTIDEGH